MNIFNRDWCLFTCINLIISLGKNNDKNKIKIINFWKRIKKLSKYYGYGARLTQWTGIRGYLLWQSWWGLHELCGITSNLFKIF